MNPEHEETTALIRAARAYANLSQPELADAIGMSLPTYKRAELGKRPVSREELLRIAEACRVPPDFLLKPMDGRYPEHRRVDAADTIGRLDLIDERLAGYDRTLARLVEVLSAHPALAGNDGEDEPSSLTR